MNGIIKDERAKIEKFRESDHKHYQESVDELHRELGFIFVAKPESEATPKPRG